MTRDQWARIKAVAAEALELPVADREAFIARASNGDRAFDREVQSLMTWADRAADLFENDFLPARAALKAGVRLGPYEVIGPLAAGAMGEVYRARDARLGRDVAIKVLPIVFSDNPDRVRRFEQEARAAGVLNHPNVVTIYDVGSHTGAPYVVSELLEGETLRERLARPMPVELGVEFARQAAEGLAAAHEKGIVHRDLKPENLFVTREHRIKILDFGLAKLVGGRDLSSDGTTPGTVLGTVGYMAPEQVRGGPADHRSDLFALGAILYEMLSGKRAFEGPSPAETMNAIVNSEPTKLSRVGPDLPEHLERVVARALEKDPERRFQTARAFAGALGATAVMSAVSSLPVAIGRRGISWRWAAAAVAVVVSAAVVFLIRDRVRRPAIIERDHIVVADIINQTGDSVFDGALKQALLIQLEPSPFLSVVSESTVRQTLRMMGRSPDQPLTPDIAREVCERAAAKATLSGSLAALGSRYVINLNASDCVTGDAFAREQEEAERKETVVAALAAATSRLRRKLGESLSSVQHFDVPVELATTSSLEALKNLSLAVAARARGADDQAFTLLNRAIELDPEFPAAHIRLSAIYSVAGELELAARHANKAYARRAATGERERLTIEHAYYKRVTGELDRAVATLRAWQQLYPRDYDPPLQLSGIHSQTGEYELAAKEARDAVMLNAPAAQAAAASGRAYLGLNDFDRLKTLSPATPSMSVAQRSLQYGIDFMKGDGAALERHVAAVSGTIGEPYVRAWHAQGAAARGRFREAREQFRLTEQAAQRFGLREVSATAVAFAALAEAVAGREPEARQRARGSVKGFFGRQSAGLAAVALAFAGANDQAAELESRLSKTYPADTLLNEVLLTTVEALAAGKRGRPLEGVEILRRAAPYEWGWTSYYLPSYVRGLLYLQAHDGPNARAQFQNIVNHRGVMVVSPLYSMAYLQLGRAAAMSGDIAAAQQAYDRFLAAWQTGDADSPVMIRARAEYRQLAHASGS